MSDPSSAPTARAADRVGSTRVSTPTAAETPRATARASILMADQGRPASRFRDGDPRRRVPTCNPCGEGRWCGPPRRSAVRMWRGRRMPRQDAVRDSSVGAAQLHGCQQESKELKAPRRPRCARARGRLSCRSGPNRGRVDPLAPKGATRRDRSTRRSCAEDRSRQLRQTRAATRSARSPRVAFAPRTPDRRSSRADRPAITLATLGTAKEETHRHLRWTTNLLPLQLTAFRWGRRAHARPKRATRHGVWRARARPVKPTSRRSVTIALVSRSRVQRSSSMASVCGSRSRDGAGCDLAPVAGIAMAGSRRGRVLILTASGRRGSLATWLRSQARRGHHGAADDTRSREPASSAQR